MNSIRYILYFVISFVLQLLWFFLVKENSNVTILDMLIMSLLFTLFMFILDKFLKKSRLHRDCFFCCRLKT
ncbi:hypothetical protein ABEW72_14550 [Bacillus velezensis]|uniref:hypothetical protein n=1 Tax=Bacillus velezensis TaxID=492670 RepID=UPI00203FEA5B|nr:hypothetical protein [Bacillus velezensis]MCM3105889.1 hypothetical protein [Bacillus velezensis]MDQ9148992.1 hypothetical protein [Bacillus velezensis]MEC2185832.1 hypothetical protein [Bacillus velezensis]MED3450255.1 hypothetical protein [Bacillus velezensis]